MADEGPEPKINFKPAQKRRTAADKFADYDAEYETRGKPSGNIIRTVHRHNNAYPKMYDELDKRRSLVEVKGVKDDRSKPSQRNKYDPKCSACRKLKILTELRNSGLGPRCRNIRKKDHKAKTNGTKKYIKNKSKITKAKLRSKKHLKTKLKNGRKTACKCGIEMKIKRGTSETSYIEESVPKPKNFFSNYSSVYYESSDDKISLKTIVPSKTSDFSDNTEVRNPDSGEPSVSSYHSFRSMDHEPMVS